MDYKAGFADYALFELGRSPSGVRQYLWRLGYLERIFGKPIEQITADDLRALRRRWVKSSSMLRGLFVAAKAIHRWGALEGHWELDGIAILPAPKEVNRLTRALDLDEVAAIKAACRRPLDFRLVYPGFYAGTRIGESADLDRPAWQGRFLMFRSEKSGRPVEMPIHPELERVRDVIMSSPTVHVSSLQKIKERLAARCGVEFVAHQLRKTFSSSLYDGDVPDEVVGDLLGHAPSVNRIYAPVSRKKRIDAVAVLPY